MTLSTTEQLRRSTWPGLPCTITHRCLDPFTQRPRMVDGRPAVERRGATWWCRFHHRTEALIPGARVLQYNAEARREERCAKRRRRRTAAETERVAAYYQAHRTAILARMKTQREQKKP